MNFIDIFLQLFIHLDKNLFSFVSNHGVFVYPFLFLVVFIETGIVIFPFLPGDSLIFASATLAGTGLLNIYFLFLVFFSAAVLGDTLNYFIGRYIGNKLISRNYIKKKYMHLTNSFFEKHGGKTIIFARFVPFVRTFAPFTAGAGKMNYRHFVFYNIFGAFVWVSLFMILGYFFGTLPIVQKNFTLSILIIIILSFIPAVIEVIKAKSSC